MIEFDVNKMTEEDLLEAANSIFKVQEKDFEKIKSEKWYKTLFRAITLNQDGKKYMVNGISSLAKLQQLFMSIYVKNYKQSHEQINEIIQAVSNNSVAIKRLYGTCVLRLEEQATLTELDAYDAEILALFLGEYKDGHGRVPENVQEYNRGVLLALNQTVPIGTLDSHQIGKLKAPKVVYRCFMEQCAVDGTIESQEWSDRIYALLKDFEMSDNSKSEIKNAVLHEAEMAGTEYFLVKYTKENTDNLDADLMKCDENDDVGQDEQKNVQIEEYESDSTCDETVEESIDCSKPLVNVADVARGLLAEDLDTLLLDKPIVVKSKTIYSNKNITVTGIISCSSDLTFENCIITYPANTNSSIKLEENGNLIFKNCRFRSTGEVNEVEYHACYFIRSESYKNTSLKLLDCFFEKCEFFAYCKINRFVADGNLFTVGLEYEEKLLDYFYEKYRLLEIYCDDRSFFVNNKIADTSNHANEWISINNYYKDELLFENNYICRTRKLDTKNRLRLSDLLSLYKCKINNCTFANLDGGFNITHSLINKSVFYKCEAPLTHISSTKIKNCLFYGCNSTVFVSLEDSSISNSRFIDIKGSIVSDMCNVQFTDCEFKYVHSKGQIKGQLPDFIGYLIGERNTKGSLFVISRAEDRDNRFLRCYFENIILDGGYLIESRSVSEKPKYHQTSVNDCVCKSVKYTGKNLINCYVDYTTKLTKKEISCKVIDINNCVGMDKSEDCSFVVPSFVKVISEYPNDTTLGANCPVDI